MHIVFGMEEFILSSSLHDVYIYTHFHNEREALQTSVMDLTYWENWKFLGFWWWHKDFFQKNLGSFLFLFITARLQKESAENMIKNYIIS